MKGWTFKREPQWMLWLGLAPAVLLLWTLLMTWFRRLVAG
jgi:hypothetical protein